MHAEDTKGDTRSLRRGLESQGGIATEGTRQGGEARSTQNHVEVHTCSTKRSVSLIRLVLVRSAASRL